MLQNFRRLGAPDPTLSFTPVLVPMARGILATVPRTCCGRHRSSDRLMAELRIIAPAIGRGICLEPVGGGWGV